MLNDNDLSTIEDVFLKLETKEKRARYIEVPKQVEKILRIERVQKLQRKQGRGEGYETLWLKKRIEQGVRIKQSAKEVLASPNRDKHPAVRVVIENDKEISISPNARPNFNPHDTRLVTAYLAGYAL